MPVSSAPIRRGAIAVDNQKIVGVGTQDELANQFPESKKEDFGEAAILPGFVNAHAHLELTAMRGFLDSVENDFFQWLRKLTAARQKFSAEDFKNSALCGAIEAARAGVTLIGDIGTDANFSLAALRQVGLRGTAFQETIDPNPVSATETFNRLREQIVALRERQTETVKIGVSPHAPYSVSRRLFEFVTDYALAENLPVTIHAAEGAAENNFIRHGTGNFADFLRSRGINWNARNKSAIQYLEQTGILKTKPLLAHCVNVDKEDLEIIRETNTRIAHCPASNAKFAHGVAPFAEMLEKNIVVGLGSDSVASNNVCDILAEARLSALLQRAGGNFTSAEEALSAATLGGARALGVESKTGSLQTGKQADFCVISLAALAQQPVTDIYATVIFASSGRDVVQTIVAGETIYKNGVMQTVDENAAVAKLKETAVRINC